MAALLEIFGFLQSGLLEAVRLNQQFPGLDQKRSDQVLHPLMAKLLEHLSSADMQPQLQSIVKKYIEYLVLSHAATPLAPSGDPNPPQDGMGHLTEH
ncbi:MAG: hypothetical protein S4CHLAM81_03480 [Chlamydiales bacterium]|nr:hypothetical protein [Chlamydiales bacterium]